MKIFLTGFGGAVYQPDGAYTKQMCQIEGWEIVNALAEADCVFLSFSRPRFLFDSALLASFKVNTKPVVVFDWTETHDAGNSFIGQPSYHSEDVSANQLNEAIVGKVVGYFKRELWANSFEPFPLFPLDYPARREFSTVPDSEADYINRPIALLMCCGFTSICRMHLFSAMIRHTIEPDACAFNLNDVNVLLERKKPRIVALLHSLPGVCIPLEQVYALQQKTRLCINLRGAGRKCMRDTEATANSCAAFQAPELLQWAYPWIGGHNCCGLPHNGDGMLLETEAAIQLGQLAYSAEALYPLYVQGIANRANYCVEPYTRNHLLPCIKQLAL